MKEVKHKKFSFTYPVTMWAEFLYECANDGMKLNDAAVIAMNEWLIKRKLDREVESMKRELEQKINTDQPCITS